MKVTRRWARSSKEGKSGEPTCAGGVAGRSRAFRWADRERRGAKGSHVSGWQGTTTRTSPDRDKRPGDVEVSKQVSAGRYWTSQDMRPGAGVRAWALRLGWAIEGRAAMPRHGHKYRCAAGFRPEPKTGGAWSKNPDGQTGCSRQLCNADAASDVWRTTRGARCGALVILCFAEGLQQATSGSTRRWEASTCNSSMRQQSHGSREFRTEPMMRRSSQPPTTFSAPAPSPSREVCAAGRREVGRESLIEVAKRHDAWAPGIGQNSPEEHHTSCAWPIPRIRRPQGASIW
jgi:hypothetical protein